MRAVTSNGDTNRIEAPHVSLQYTTGTGGVDTAPGRAHQKKNRGECGGLFSENDYATARAKILECRGLQLNGLSLLEQSCSSAILEISEMKNLLDTALHLPFSYEELLSILLLIGCIETKKKKMIDISVVNVRKFFLGLRRLVDKLRNERKQNSQENLILQTKGVVDSTRIDILSDNGKLNKCGKDSAGNTKTRAVKEGPILVADARITTGREFLFLPPPNFNKLNPGRANRRGEDAKMKSSLSECMDSVRGRVGSTDRLQKVNGERGTEEEEEEKEKEKENGTDNIGLQSISAPPVSAPHTLSSGRKIMASFPMVPSTLTNHSHNYSSWRSDGLTQVLGARNGKSRLPALPSLSVSAASTAPASPCLSPSRAKGQIIVIGQCDASDRVEEHETGTLDSKNPTAGASLTFSVHVMLKLLIDRTRSTYRLT